MTKQELHELMQQLDEKYFLPDEWRRSRVIFSEADGEEAQWRECLRQSEHSLLYDNLCLLIRHNGSIATKGRPNCVPVKNFLLQNYEELVKKRVPDRQPAVAVSVLRGRARFPARCKGAAERYPQQHGR